MTGIGALLCLVFSGLGPDGLLLSRELLRMDGPLELPTASLARTAEELWLVPHQEKGWSRAFYAAPEGPLYFALLGDTERLLPGLDVPRLFLYTPHYARAGPAGRYVLRDLPVDTIEYLMKALLEAHLEREMARVGSPYPAVVRERSAKVLQEVPAEQREAVYLEAIGDFGAHILSVAHEVNRAARRAEALGRNPCALVQGRAPLLTHWERGFQRARFSGRYSRPALSSEVAEGVEALEEVEWVEVPEAVERLDKELFVRHIFDGVWVGNMEIDFAEFCRP